MSHKELTIAEMQTLAKGAIALAKECCADDPEVRPYLAAMLVMKVLDGKNVAAVRDLLEFCAKKST